MQHYIIPQQTHYCIVSPAGEIIRNSVEFLALFSNETALEYVPFFMVGIVDHYIVQKQYYFEQEVQIFLVEILWCLVFCLHPEKFMPMAQSRKISNMTLLS